MSIESAQDQRRRNEAANALRENHDTMLRIRALVDDARIGILHNSGISGDTLNHADFSGDPASGRAIWNALREERAAILAMLLEDAWLTFHRASQSSPTGLVEQWNNVRNAVSPATLYSANSALERLVRAFSNMVRWTMDEWQESREAFAQADTPLDANFRRLSQMLQFGRRHEIMFENAAGYFTNGFSGAVQMHVGATEVIPKVYSRERGAAISAEEYASFLGKSYHQMFSLPAHFDKSIGVPMMNMDFRQDPNSANNLSLDPLSYTLENGTLERIEQVSLPARALEMAHIGCSALHAKTPEGVTVHRATFNFLTKLTKDYHISRFS